jgi:hypothetical protein
MARPEEPNNVNPIAGGLADRVAQYKHEVERVVREVGEHPLYELKRSCLLTSLSEKIEFVKDIQAISTSHIEHEKYLVIGADQATRAFCPVINRGDFDDAKVRQILEKYLTPVPVFEVLPLESADGHPYVLFVIPKQPRRRILARVTVHDPSDSRARLLLRKGDLWTKGSSTGKRLAEPEDWDDIYEEVVEARAENKARIRTAHAVEMALDRDKSAQYGSESVPRAFTDETFQTFMEHACLSKDSARVKIVLERLRDDTVEGWHRIGAYEDAFARDFVASDSATAGSTKKSVRDHVANVLRPAIRWLTLLGIYTVKNEGPVAFLEAVVDLLNEIFETANKLRIPSREFHHEQPEGSDDGYDSNTVPALESLISLHLIGSYIVKRKRFEYFRSLFRAEARGAGFRSPTDRGMVVFWPLNSEGEGQELRAWGGRLRLCGNKVQNDLAIQKLFGSEPATIDALCQYELCLELNSSLAVSSQFSQETAAYVKQAHPDLNFYFRADFPAFPLTAVEGLAKELLNEVKQSRPRLLKEILFDPVLTVHMTKPGATKVMGHFLDEIAKIYAQVHQQVTRGWSHDLANQLRQIRESNG